MNNPLPEYKHIEAIQSNVNTVIYRGTREPEQTPVIIKSLKAKYPTLEEITRLRHEYKILQPLQIEGIVKAYALTNYNNGLALILEDFRGESLKIFLANQKLKLNEFLQIAIQISSTLGLLHQNNIIHKNIKPHNILINPETRQVKLTDFSVATRLSRENQSLSHPKLLEGTLAYMSPEQTGRMNRAIDYRTDLYSLGVTFYEMLTGILPFQATEPLELVHCHIAKQPLPPRQLNPEIPQAVSEIVMKLLSKTAEDRYQSAYGLKADLEQCLDLLQATGHSQAEPRNEENFILGQQDLFSQFLIPQKLYGREEEVVTLMDAFERVSQGKTEMMLVSGYSGIGKSSLVNEVHKPIVGARVYFISGKFDQFKRNIPYSSLIQAFQSLLRQLLTESSENLATGKSKLLEAFASNGRVIIDVIPEVELIVGKQRDVTSLGPTESQNRFNRVFQEFIQVFTKPEHPLVLFLDDLQWADSASLKLMTLLMSDPDSQYLLLIGAYRDNEVSATHPLIHTLDQIHSYGTAVTNIILQPLDISNVSQLVADTLGETHFQADQWSRRSSPLAELVFNKTQGNPFFLTQLLQSLHSEKLLTFDFTPQSGGWQWDIAQIQAVGITDYNVVELIARNIQKLPIETQKVLKLASCIGDRFNLDVLAIVNEKSQSETAADLWDALQAGLVLPLSEAYKIPLVFDQEAEGLLSRGDLVNYKFLHDRVQQAAYFLIPESQKQETHLKIGELLLKHIPASEIEDNIFEIVNQLNIGVDFITSQVEKERLAQLNLIAGRKAKASNAYEPAAKYLTAGLNLLSSDSWQSQYDLTLALYESTIEAEYLNTNYQQAKTLIDVALEQARTLLDKVKIYGKKIRFYVAQSDMQAGIDTALLVLEMLGVPLPTDASEMNTGSLALQRELVFEIRQIGELANLPVMTDTNKLAAMQILISIIGPVYFHKPALLLPVILTMVSLSVKYGNSAPVAYGYCLYGLLLCGAFGDIASGYEFGQLSLKILEQFDAIELKCRVFKVFGSHIQPWKEPSRASVESLLRAVQNGLETGDIEYTVYGSAEYCMYLFFSGENLEVVENKYVQFVELVERLKQEVSIYYIKIGRQISLNLAGLAADPCRLIGDSFNEDTMLPIIIEANYQMLIFCVYCFKLILLYLFKDYSGAIANAKLASAQLEGVVGIIYVAQHNFYYSLALLAQYPAGKTEQEQVLSQVTSNQSAMQNWAFHAPCNFKHKYDLVAAEKARVLGQTEKAMEYYDQAIQGAKEQGYIQEEALASELAAEFYFSRGREKIAIVYLTDAYYSYIRWGATAKVKDLSARYPQVFSQLLTRETSDISVTSTTHFTTGFGSAALDLATVLKASQAISGEIVLDKLLEKLMHILMESAGARTGLLLLVHAGKLVLVAEANLEDKFVVLPSISIETRPLPIAIINYVERTQETVVLNDATQSGFFTNDSYIVENKPKSILCLPIIYQSKLEGILYLENNLTKGAFTQEHLEVLNMLSSQAAISLEKAGLYQELQTYSQKLEKQNTELIRINESLQAEITERQRVEKALQQSEEQTRLAVESTELGTWDYYPITGVLRWCDRCKAVFGLPPEASVNYDVFLSRLHPEDRERTDKIVQRALDANGNGEYNIEYRSLWPDGTVRWVAAMGRAFFNEKKQAYRFIGTILDITKRKLAEDQIKASLQEKVVLLKEIHHRVKNNLQIISSLLNLQSNYIDDPQTLEILQSGQNRVASMALIHEQLYQSEDFAKIDFAEYIQNLAYNLFSSYENSESAISFQMNILDVYLGIDEAIPCGLIINELIFNSLEYAFPKGKKGRIRIDFNSDNDKHYTLIFRDDGIGIPEDLDWKNTDSLGLKLVNVLTNQLGGTLELNKKFGTEFKLTFSAK